MSAKISARKQEQKDRLIEAARTLIAEQGLKGLRARDIAERAGCALGGLYTVFADIDELILHVNSRTLRQLEQALAGAVEEGSPASPFEALALAYLAFAIDNTRLWSALFEHRMPEGVPVPDWHLQEHAFLVGLIIPPLGSLMPDMPLPQMITRARTLFAAVHGVIAISLENRFIGLAADALRDEVRALARILADGLRTP